MAIPKQPNSELKGIFIPVRAPIAPGPQNANLPAVNAWTEPTPPAPTPEEYVRRAINQLARGEKDDAIRLNIPNAGRHAATAQLLNNWLLNGTQSMSATDLETMLTVFRGLIAAEDNMQTTAQAAARRSYLRQLEGEILVAQVRAR